MAISGVSDMASVNNTLALLNMYRDKGVSAFRTPCGIRFAGLKRLTDEQREVLLRIEQSELNAALRWQK